MHSSDDRITEYENNDKLHGGHETPDSKIHPDGGISEYKNDDKLHIGVTRKRAFET